MKLLALLKPDMINSMNKGLLIGVVGLAVSAFAMTALAQVDTASTSTTPLLEVATTTEARSTATTTVSTSTASTTPPASESATVIKETPTTAAAIASTPATAQGVSALEDAYFQKNGKYLQVIPGNQLPEYESGT